MKNFKFIFVFLVFAGFASCSNDDDADQAGTEHIIGKWKIQQLILDGEQVPLSDCEKQSTVEFMTNGTMRSTEFFEDFETEECVSEIYTEDWENRGNNVYRFTDEDITYDVTIIFSNNNNTFKVSVDDEDGSYSTTYVRI